MPALTFLLKLMGKRCTTVMCAYKNRSTKKEDAMISGVGDGIRDGDEWVAALNERGHGRVSDATM